MASNRTIVGLGVLGLAAYLYWRRTEELAASGPAASASGTVAGAGQCSTGLAAQMAAAVKALPPGSTPNTGAIIKTVGASATAVASAVNPVAGAVVGVASVVAGTLFSIFQGKPLDPVVHILIQEQPYAYAERNNTIEGEPIYALDSCGYLHPLQAEVNAAGYSYRDIIAVNWEVFAMMPKIGTPVTSVADLRDAGIEMPRPSDAATLRGALGNDILFKLGTDNTVHGPWESDANVPPIPGSPAQWVAFAGQYDPTETTVPAGSWG